MSFGCAKSSAAAEVKVVLPVKLLIVSSSVNSSPTSPNTAMSLAAKETLLSTVKVVPLE